MHAVNAELEAFSYSVSHDLRAPLRHIDGFANLLTKHANTTLDEKSRRYVDVISEAARKMGRLIDDLLEFSRTGRAQMRRTLVNQDVLVAEVIRDGRYNVRPIEWKIAPMPEVHADAAMLRQVWTNYLDNAVKYTSKVEHPVIEIGTQPGNTPGERVFFVRDNGAGFDMRYVEKLFGVFQRLHTEAEFEGTGIGLANVRRVVTRHGGRTWAEGSLGAGSVFYFSLPPAPPFNSPT
jgi:light-regulated signal transduction histidine kinase (bacteriophytochrome)